MISYLNRKFRLDFSSLAKEGSWLVGGQFLRVLFGLATTVALARALDPATFGLYKYVLTLVAVLSVFSMPGIDVALLRLVARSAQSSLAFLFTKLRYGLLGTLIAIGFGIHALGFNAGLANALFAIALLFPLEQGFRLFEAYLNGKKLFKTLSIHTTVRTGLQLVATFAALYFAPSLLWVLLAMTGVGFLYNLVAYFAVRGSFVRAGTLTEISPEEKAQALRYGKRLSWLQLFSMITDQFDRFLVIYLFSAADLAMYSIAITFPDQIRGFLKNASIVAMPRFSKLEGGKARSFFFKHLRGFLLFSSLAALAYIVCAPLLFKIFFPQYMDGVLLSQIAGLTIIPLTALVRTLLESQQDVRLQFNQKIFAGVSRVALVVALSPFGLLGITWALVLSRTSVALYSLALARKV